MNGPHEVNPFSSPRETEAAPATHRADSPDGPQGIGGWLILVTIGLVITPFRMAFLLITTHLPLFTGGQMAILTDPQSQAYHPLWGPLLALEVLCNLGFGTAAVVALVLMFRRSRLYPRFMIVYYASNLAFIALDTLLSNMIPAVAQAGSTEMIGEVGKAMISCAIWIPYMCVSKRVKNTFVR
jgi:hypothetical protein